MKGPELLLAQDYWAATLERIGDLEGARLHALAMIKVDPVSHKGYLRHGKILRLMGKLHAAITTYQEGLRTANSGHNEIAEQLRLAMTSNEMRAMNSSDPFIRLPPHILDRILDICVQGPNARTPKWKKLDSIALLSRFSAHYCQMFYRQRPHALNLYRKFSKPEIKRLLQNGVNYTSLCLPAANMALFCKAASDLSLVTCKLRSLILEGPVTEDMIPLQKADCLTAIESLTIRNQDPLPAQTLHALGKLIPRVTSLVVQNCPNMTLGAGQCWVLLKNLTLIQSNSAEVSWDAFESLERLSVLDGNYFWLFLDGFQGLRSLTAIKTDDSFLHHLPDLLSDIEADLANETPVAFKLRSLSINFPDAPRANPNCANNCLSNLAIISQNLVRLHISGHLDVRPRNARFEGSDVRVGGPLRLHFPNLKHLFLGDVGPFLQITFWEMPRLETFCMANSSSTRIEQLPRTLEHAYLVEVLVQGSDCSDIPVQMFQTLAKSFLQGHIRVLGVGNAHRLYQKDGHARLEQLALSQPSSILLYWPEQVEQRISRLWPATI